MVRRNSPNPEEPDYGPARRFHHQHCPEVCSDGLILHDGLGSRFLARYPSDQRAPPLQPVGAVGSPDHRQPGVARSLALRASLDRHHADRDDESSIALVTRRAARAGVRDHVLVVAPVAAAQLGGRSAHRAD